MITETLKKLVMETIRKIEDDKISEKSFSDFIVSKEDKGQENLLLIYKPYVDGKTYFVYQRI